MSATIARGLSLAAVLTAILVAAPAGASAASHAEAPVAQKKCTKAIVGGKHACLRKGDKCKKRFQDDYVAAGYSCKKGKLRKASIKQLRGPEPLLIDKQGQISLDTALAGFDVGIADLPGVKPKKGEVGKLDDATMVVEEIEGNLGKLTAAQRKVFTAAVTPAPDAVTIPAEGGAATPSARSAAHGRAPATQAEITEAEGFINDAIPIMRSHGFALLRPIKVSFTDEGGTSAAYVTGDDLPPGTSPTCNLFMATGARSVNADLKRVIVTHELAHCAQHAFYATDAQRLAAPKWVKEGGADWMAVMTLSELGKPVVGHWDGWLKDPRRDLFKRSYDALGFFAMIQQAGVDGWARMRAVLSASTTGGQAAYAAAIAGLPDIFYMRWGPGILRDPSLGPEWDYAGPGIPSSQAKQVTVGTGAPYSSQIDAHASAGGTLKINADIVNIKADKGINGRMRFGGTTLPLKKGAYCAKAGGCKCRTNTPLQLPQLGATTFVGFNDPAKKRVVTFQGQKLKDYCKHPTPPPSGGDNGGGGSCPTTPGGGSAKRECPAPSPGITVNMGQDAVQVANFTIGSCTQGPGGFTALAESNGWNLEVGISNFTGFGSYTIPYGGPDPLVVVEAPDGTVFSNTTWQPPGLTFSGAIDFNNGDRHHMGLGWIEYREASGTNGISGAGGMTCVYPDDEA